MYVASIVPTRHLHLVADDPYHLVLAQAVGKYKQYTTFYKQLSDDGKFITLDNGAAEGECMEIDELYARAFMVNAKEIVLPDEFFEAQQTLDMVDEAYNYLYDNDWTGNIMAVPQGQDIEEWVRCAVKIVVNYPAVNVIGVPKNLVHLGGWYGRAKGIARLIEEASYRRRPFHLHLLGCWLDPREVSVIYKIFGNHIRSVDSRMPYLYAKTDNPLSPKYEKPKGREMDFDDCIIDEGLLEDNIRRWRAYAYGELW